MRLIIAGGGTGGHLFPGIAVAEEFLSRDSSNEVLFVGSEKGIEARAIPKLGYRLELISAAGIKGKGGFSKLKGAAMLLYGYAQSRKILKQFKPDLVMGVGGYASLPMVMAARGMEIPRFVHEQNALPGLSNRVLARVADRVFISLAESARFFPPDKTVLTGNPLRRQILEGIELSREHGADPDAAAGRQFHLFVFGGSQGAHALNVALPKAMTAMPEAEKARLRITHQTGEKDLEEVMQAYGQAGLEADVRSFIDDMAGEYRKADLIICRAGATTIAEVTACGKACLFVPFPHATDDHQRKNAEALLKTGACEMLLERELSDQRLAETLVRLMNSPEEIRKIEANAATLARLDAASVILDEMLKGLKPCTEK
jgi:UDP-N-acetylglucosamine--N-acetylmuramyl-(pentapeptide) pyrophosphoryl-undecaprenol N-acetylglucosamine transferase